jgi:hypothetical protein
MKKTAFDRRNIIAGKTVIRVIVTTPKSKRTTRKGLVSEITDTTITLIHNFKRTEYKIEDLIGLTIEGTI